MASDITLAPTQENFASGHRCQNQEDHEVFLSHSGKQKPFVHGLFDKFVNLPRFQSNKPFFDVDDESLPKGEEWRYRLIKAARNCKVAVLILTKDFLTSHWPMLELLHFIDAKKIDNPDMKLLPVFFGDFKPSDLSDLVIEDRWKVEWEKITGTRSSVEPRKISFTVESSKKALQIVRTISGIKHNSQPFGLLVEDIVSKVLTYLPSGFDPEINPNVEGCHRLCNVISQMFPEKNDEGTQCLGLYGVGGSGKTTLSKAMCSFLGPSVNHRVYHLQIGNNDPVKAEENLIERHKELLKKLIGLSQEEVDRIRDPRKVLEMRMKKQGPVFLAVDDVREDVNSCQEVRNYLRYLCPGSKMLITARSRDIVESVIGHPEYCKPIPNLEKEEALSLFLKIAAPARSVTSLGKVETKILKACLKIGRFFTLEDGTTHSLVPPEAGRDLYKPSTKTGHYHPLALRAVASYFKDRYSKHRNIIQSGKEVLRKKKLLFRTDASKSIFDVLGFGFNEICHVGKQLFIDVALYAPRADAEAGDEDVVFNWLVDIHVHLEPDAVQMQLEHLRKMSFLHYEDPKDDDISGHSACMYISMHDLYREYAIRLVNEHKNEESYKYGVYNDQSYHQAPVALATRGWAKAPRIRLKRWNEELKVNLWCTVSVIHLVHCETITTFLIGHELLNLLELKIRHCSKLEVLNWTQGIISESLRGVKLCFVELLFNESLKILPDFSNCSELRELVVIECSDSVESLHLHNCPSLQSLRIAGKNAPEVRSLQSCRKLRSVQLAWKASHQGLQVSNLPSLLELMIVGPSILPTGSPLESIVPHGHSMFCQHYPEESVCYELTGVRELTNLKTLRLEYIQLGCLPRGLRSIGSRLEILSLRGSLLSQLMDFSEFPNLRCLSIAQTNVKKLRGLGSLKKLEELDCKFTFRLQEISDLRSSKALEFVYLDQCPELRVIPRLPRKYYRKGPPGSEEVHRQLLAVAAFAKTTKSDIPPPLFALLFDHPCARLVTSSMLHLSVQCDGCMMYPLSGPRFKARDIRTTYDLCQKCLTNNCQKLKGEKKCIFNSKRYRLKKTVELNYDLCFGCFHESGCDERDFYQVDSTIRGIS